MSRGIEPGTEGNCMFQNYLKTALRKTLKGGVYSFINITGLAIGMSVCLLIMLWVQYELRYDDFQTKGDRICRVITYYPDMGKRACSPALLGPTAKAEVPEIEEFARFKRMNTVALSSEEVAAYEDGVILLDPQLFNMFSLPFIRGTAESALAAPYQVAVSESMAKKYFGDADPVGRTLTVDNSYSLAVTGVFKDIPENCHLRFDFACPLELVEAEDMCALDWGSSNFMTYFELAPGAAIGGLDSIIMAVSHAHDRGMGQLYDGTYWYLQPLSEIHLDGSIGHNVSKRSDIEDVWNLYLFSTIALAILLVACINFMNMVTAQSVRRVREIGIRKTVGACRSQLVVQHCGESLGLAALAGLLAVGLAELFLPVFNEMTGNEVSLKLASYATLMSVGGIVLVTALLAGSYPAFYLASLDPARAVRGGLRPPSGSGSLRKILVVAQFAVSIVLICATVVIYRQLAFTQNYSPGFDSSSLIHIPLSDNMVSRYEYAKQELLQHPDILSVTAKDCLPTTSTNRTTWVAWEGHADGNREVFETTRVDYGYFKTLGMEVIQGRDFSPDHPSDATEAFILNEEAVRVTGLTSPVGRSFAHGHDQRRIIGVVKNAHLQSFRRAVQPRVFSVLNDLPNQADAGSVILIKITDRQVPQVLGLIEKVWKEVNPRTPFTYGFLDDTMDKMYSADRTLLGLITWLAGLTVFVSCLGLFGLAMFAAESRTKEIGIRKVMGASVAEIIRFMSQDTLILVALANLIAWPIAWFAVNGWLDNFAYRVDIGLETFLFAALVAFGAAAGAVSHQAVRAARANPVEALKYE